MAHPEEIKKKSELITGQKTSKFIIDAEKMKLNAVKVKVSKSLKSEKKVDKKSSKSKEMSGKKKIKKGANKIWTIEECSSESESEEATNSNPDGINEPSNVPLLELSDIDKSFKIKKYLEKQKNGSFIEIIRPEFFQDEDIVNDESQTEQESDNQSKSDDEKESKKTLKDKIPMQINAHPLMEKLKASRFRYLNELLYTNSSNYSFDFFQK